jgi:hypothetical protein
MRPIIKTRLTAAQKSKVTFTLFSSVALFAIFTVAAPAILPCPAFDETQRKALLEQRRKSKLIGRKEVVIEPRKHQQQNNIKKAES